MSSIWTSLVTIVFLSSAGLARAEEVWAPPPIVPAYGAEPHLAPAREAAEDARDSVRMKNTGRALTYIGIASAGIVAAGGLITYVSLQQAWQGGGDINILAISGIMIMMAGGAQGVVTLATGIPLWAVGAHKERQSQIRLTGLAVVPVFDRGGIGGATAQVGFRF